MEIQDLFDKTAFKPLSSIKNQLEGSIDDWPQQILQVLYEEHPYLAESEIGMEVLRADPENGYLFGMANVSFSPDGKSDIQIPVLVKNWELQPFMVMIAGEEVYPLNEKRFGMIAPQVMEDTPIHGMSEEARSLTETPIDTNPPNTTQIGDPSLISKVSSDKSTIEHMKAVVEPLPRIKERLEKSGIFERVASMKEPSLGLYHDTALIIPLPAAGVSVSTTSASFRKVAHRVVSVPDARRLFGKEALDEAYRKGYLVVSDTPIKLAEADIPYPVFLINRPGIYEVRLSSGEPLIGMVFPVVVDLMKRRLPLSIFFNGSSSAVQNQIAGTMLAEAKIPPPETTPKGECVFLFRGLDGNITSTVPFAVNSSIPGPDGVSWACETYLNESVMITQGDVMEPLTVANGEVCVPASWALVRIGDPANRCSVAETPEAFDSLAKMAASAEGSIRIFSLGSGEYSLKGEGYNAEFSRPELHFHLASLGAPDPERLMKKANSMGTVRLIGPIPQDLSESLLEKFHRKTAAYKKTAEKIRTFIDPLIGFSERILGSQESSVQSKLAQMEPESLDSLLSLGFVNDGNTEMFLESIGTLEDAVKKLAGLVLAAELGYDKIPLDEAVMAMNNLEMILDSLNEMQESQEGV